MSGLAAATSLTEMGAHINDDQYDLAQIDHNWEDVADTPASPALAELDTKTEESSPLQTTYPSSLAQAGAEWGRPRFRRRNNNAARARQ